MIGQKQQQELIRHEINRCYAPTHLSYKKLQKETLCDIQLSSLIFLDKYISILQALCTLFHIEETTFFKKGQFQGSLKELNLEQNLC